MNMSKDLMAKISQLLEAKPRVSFNKDGCDVLDKGGNCVRSFKQKDLGEKYKKEAENFLSQNYAKLNSEGFVWAIDEAKKKKDEDSKDKGDMDNDGKDEPDDKEYMDNKDKAIKNSKKGKKNPMFVKNDKEDEPEEAEPGENKLKEGMVDAIKSKLHPSRPERNAASRRQDAEASRKKAVKSAVASTIAKSNAGQRLKDKPMMKESDEISTPEVEAQPAPLTQMERMASYISGQVQRADGSPTFMGAKKSELDESKLQEISTKTMRSYVGKAKNDVAHHQNIQRAADKGMVPKSDPAVQFHKKEEEKRKVGINTAVKKLSKEEIDQNSSDPEKSIGHNCATHVEHAEYGAGQCIPGMHSLEEVKEVECSHCKGTGKHGDKDCKSCKGTGKIMEGVATKYDVMFRNEDGPFIKEAVSIEDLTIVQEMHHGHKKKKKK